MLIVLLGAPGAGKGTQAAHLQEKLQAHIIATGDMMREAAQRSDEIGRCVADCLAKGNLVPDEVVYELLHGQLQALKGQTVILDGFPRTYEQAVALDERCEVDLALCIRTPDEVIVERMSGRRICPKCHAVYHVVSLPPRAEGYCDVCGSELLRRSDDNPETVRQRLRVFHSTIGPILRFYEEKGVLKQVDGLERVEDTTRAVCDVLGIAHD